MSTPRDDLAFAIHVHTIDKVLTPRAFAPHDNGQRSTEVVWADGRPLPGAVIALERVPVQPAGLRWQLRARAPEPIKAARFTLDLPAMRMLAPEEIDLPDGEWRQWDFPKLWRIALAVFQGADGRCFHVSTHEHPWRLKRLRALRSGDRMRLEIVQDASLRERALTFESSWWDAGWTTSPDALLDACSNFLERVYGLKRWEERDDVPDWLRRVCLVVNLHGMDWQGRVHLDFDALRAACERLATMIEPARVLLYVVAWDGRYMRHYPDYEISPELGGTAGFGRFIDAARRLGFRVMPHFNAMSVDLQHPWYVQHLSHYVLRNADGTPVHCRRIDWDGDGLGDSTRAYLALEPPGWRELLVERIARIVDRCGVDAVFLDETCNVFYNDPVYDQAAGVQRLVADLRQRWPHLLVAGEEWNEMLLSATPLVQAWERTGDGRLPLGYRPSPLMTRWAARYIRTCGYLGMVSPTGSTGVHEWPDGRFVPETDLELLHIPTLSLTRGALDHDQAVRAVIEHAQRYHERFLA